MIGGARTTVAPLPPVPPNPGVYAKGVRLHTLVGFKAVGLSQISDSFDNLDAWTNVYGKLLTTSGNVHGPLFGYAAGIHKTQLLTDNGRATVTIQSGTVLLGESRVAICADPQMNAYYGMAIKRTLLGSTVSIIRGRSTIAVDKFETTTVTVNPGDVFMVWYDRRNSRVRVYRNSSEICSKYFAPTDIPHGPGHRWTGLIMSCMQLLDGGARFTSFAATDVAYPAPVVHDPVDALTPNPGWVAVLNNVKVTRHVLIPPTLGPDNGLYSSSAVRWTTEMGSTKARIVVTIVRVLSGKCRIVLRSNSAMTNWIGLEFDGQTNKISVVKGTGPNTVTLYGSLVDWIATYQQWTVTWDDTTLRVYRGAEKTPRISWAPAGDFTPSGKYVGLSWTTTLGQPGVELMAFDGYDVTADDPL